MTEANTQSVEKCAALARLDVTPEEARQLSADFDRIFEAFRGLSELDVTDVEPMIGAGKRENVLREDRTAESLATAKLMDPAPKVEDDLFSVPKTVDTGS